MSDGWIKLDRGIQDNFLWEDKPFAMGQAWIDLLMMANWKDNKRIYKGELIIQKRGQIITTTRALADRWGWTTKKVRKFLEVLEADAMVVVTRSSKGTTLSIEKYALYQGEGQTMTPDREQPRPQTGNNDDPTTEERKKLKESIKKAEEEAGPPSKEEVDRRLAALRARRDQVNKEWRNT